MNTGLDCDRLGGVGQGSGTVNIARTHAGMYARTGPGSAACYLFHFGHGSS